MSRSCGGYRPVRGIMTNGKMFSIFPEKNENIFDFSTGDDKCVRL